MKNLIYYLCILCSAKSIFASNDTIKMFNSENVWVIGGSNFNCYSINPQVPFNGTCRYNEYLKPVEDTIIGDNQYYRIETFNWQDIDPYYREDNGQTTPRVQNVIFRQVGEKILFRYKVNENLLNPIEQVLYDFGMNPGDSLVLNFNDPFPYPTIKVVDTTHYTYNSINYNVLQIECGGMYDIWVEGIGSMMFPDVNTSRSIGMGCNAIPSEHYWELVCFKVNDIKINHPFYTQLFQSACNQEILSLENLPKKFNFVNVLPNPASSYIHLQSPQPISQVLIYNTQGTEVLQATNPETTNNTISIAHLPTGAYICRTLTTKGWLSNKFIKN